jgi:hypothetical protein
MDSIYFVQRQNIDCTFVALLRSGIVTVTVGLSWDLGFIGGLRRGSWLLSCFRRFREGFVWNVMVVAGVPELWGWPLSKAAIGR